ncbi:hypothetical protein EB118_24875, partial [bacterium]|nr:hypothetical protein [bacterium]
MSKLESEQQELKLFFNTTVSPANSPESKRLVAEAPYHPGYESAVFQTTSLSDDSLFITTNTDPGKDLYNKYNIIFSNTTKSKAQKFDSDKLPVNLLSSEALLQTAAVMKFGADKYSEHNWRSGFAWSRPLAAAMRHI